MSSELVRLNIPFLINLTILPAVLLCLVWKNAFLTLPIKISSLSRQIDPSTWSSPDKEGELKKQGTLKG